MDNETLNSVSLISLLEKEGYTHIRGINGVLCGIRRFAFTTGLVVGLEKTGYEGRYCYSNHADAVQAIENWEMNGDPEGNWIKYKGISGERSNINYKD